jgi:hypothetical protein
VPRSRLVLVRSARWRKPLIVPIDTRCNACLSYIFQHLARLTENVMVNFCSATAQIESYSDGVFLHFMESLAR